MDNLKGENLGQSPCLANQKQSFPFLGPLMSFAYIYMPKLSFMYLIIILHLKHNVQAIL